MSGKAGALGGVGCDDLAATSQGRPCQAQAMVTADLREICGDQQDHTICTICLDLYQATLDTSLRSSFTSSIRLLCLTSLAWRSAFSTL